MVVVLQEVCQIGVSKAVHITGPRLAPTLLSVFSVFLKKNLEEDFSPPSKFLENKDFTHMFQTTPPGSM